MSLAFWILACFAASFPWRNDAVFGMAARWPKYQQHKPLWLTLLESLCLYGLALLAMFVIETSRGERAAQTWQFWVILFSLWVVLSFPAAAWFKLRKTY